MTGVGAWRMRDGSFEAVLAGPSDEAGFRDTARALASNGVEPGRVRWRVGSSGGSTTAPGLFARDVDTAAAHDPLLPDAGSPLGVPREFVELTSWLCLHSDQDRFALLYELLWRLKHEPALRSDPLDAQWVQAQQMAQAVRRDLHKMKAFVRFRTVVRPSPQPPLHVAWFEPGHHVLERVAPFFARRFANMDWTILTPLGSVCWVGQALQFGPPANRNDAPPADAGEALWLTYYQHIFNPARLKLAMMEREMPRRYWTNLPEARLIQPLTAAAHERSTAMIDRPPSVPTRKLGSLPMREARETVAGPEPVAAGAPPADRGAELAATRRAASACQRCPLHASATQTVFGEGPADARLMFVGEQAGDQEDLHGRPFVGPAGQLFDRALAELGVRRDSVYITNAVKHFKYELRGQRRIHKTPLQQEVAACLDWLERELALVQPSGVVALGATAARALLGRPVSVTRERGSWLARSDGIKVLVTWHPSALLRMPPDERDRVYRQWLADLALAAQIGVLEV